MRTISVGMADFSHQAVILIGSVAILVGERWCGKIGSLG